MATYSQVGGAAPSLNKPNKIELLSEAYRRGILPENKKPLYEEAVRRGLIQPETDPFKEAAQRFAAENPQIDVQVTNESAPAYVGGAENPGSVPAEFQQMRQALQVQLPDMSGVNPQEIQEAIQLPETRAARMADIDRRAAAGAVEAIPRPLRPLVGGLAQSGLTSASLLTRPLEFMGSNVSEGLQREAVSFTQGQQDIGDSHFEQIATGAVRSVADALTMGRLIPGGSGGALSQARGVIGALTAKSINDAVTEGRQAGLSGPQLAGYASLQGGLEGLFMSAFQMAGLGGVEDIAISKTVTKGLMPVLRQMGVSALHELPEELLTTLAQQTHKTVAGVDKNGIANLPSALFDTALQTLLTVGLSESIRTISQPSQPATPAQPTPAAPTTEAISVASVESPIVETAVPTETQPAVTQAETSAQQPEQAAPVAKELPSERPDPPPGLTRRELTKWAAENGYDVADLGEKPARYLIENRIAEQRLQTAAQRTMEAQRGENVRAMAEQKQLPKGGETWDAGRLRRFAQENQYEIDERRVQIEMDRGVKPRDAVRRQIEAQYALPKGKGVVGELPKPTSIRPADAPPSQGKQAVTAIKINPRLIGLPNIPRDARSWSFTQFKRWAKTAGYRVSSAQNLSTLRRQIRQQRADGQIPNLPRPPKSARNWTFKQFHHWARQNGYNVEGVEGTFSLRKAIKQQRSAALKAVRQAGRKPSSSTALQKLQSELEAERKLRRTDPLTGAKNIVAYREESQQILQDADAKGEHTVIAESDLGNFKVANDELGHDVGDDLLRAEAAALNEALRTSSSKGRAKSSDRPLDITGLHGYRLGGDEFPAILRNVGDEDTAYRILKRASDLFDQKAKEIIGDRLPKEAYPFISWGVEIRQPGDTRTIEQLRKAAESKVVPQKNRIKAERGIPETREALQRYIAALRNAAKTTNKAVQKVTPIEGTDHKRRLPMKLEEYITPIASRVRDLSPRLFDRLMRMEFDVGTVRENEKRMLTPHAEKITEALGGPASEKYKKWSLDVLNGDFDSAKAALPDSVHENFAAFVEMFNRFREAQEASGVKLGRLDNYWARYLKDYKAFDAVYGDDKGQFEDAWNLARATQGRALLTTDEKADIANDVIQGFGPRKPGSFGPTHARERRIEKITAEQLQYYIDPFAAAMRYIDGATYAAGRSRFLGQNQALVNLDETIGKIVQEEIDAGNLKKSAQEELTHLLQTRFTADMLTMSKNARNLKQLMYLMSLGQVRSAVTQITDLAATIATHGAGSASVGVKAAARLTPADKRLVMEDIGLHSHGEEFKDVGALARATDRALKLTGFTMMDRFGKETRINAAWDQFQQAARSPESSTFKELEREYKPVFGERFNDLVADLKEGRKSENVRYLVFLDVAKVQPVTMSNMPEKYLKMKNGRIFYAMKTFTIQQLDFVRRDMVRDLTTMGRRLHGLKKLSSLIVLATLMGMSKDWVLDMLRGKHVDADQLPDRSLDALLGIAGMNQWLAKQFADRPVPAFLNFVAPPLSWVDRMWDDVKTFGDGEGFNSTKYVPLVGEPWYYWFGKGADLDKDEAKADFRSKLADIREEAYLARQSGDLDTARQLLAVYNDRRKQGASDGRIAALTFDDLRYVPPSARDRKADQRNKLGAVSALRAGNLPEARRLMVEYNTGRKNKIDFNDLRKIATEDETQ